MKLSEIAGELPKTKIVGDAEIKGLCTDSRVAGAGDLFCCFRGTHSDSHTFAESAYTRGAAAILCEREIELPLPQLIVPDGREYLARVAAAFYRHPERQLKLVGITGTNGKTTTAHLLKSILGTAQKNTGLIGTLGAFYTGRSVAPSLTTPDPVFLFSLLSDMRQAGVEYVVMEVSAHALALRKECPLQYKAAIFTNLTRDHLDFFGEMSAYGNAKKLLFERAETAILNADDEFSREIGKVSRSIVTYGLDSPADAFAILREESLRGCRLYMNLNDELLETTLSLTGRHNVYNALAAACAARSLGCGAAEIAAGLQKAECVAGRLERVGSFCGGDIFVDFAHTPDGLKKSLESLREHCKGKLYVLFGCGGNRDGGKRGEMGETAARLSDFAVLTSDNPRFEDPCAIIAEIEKGYRRVSKNYVCIEERQKATEYAVGLLREGDILLVAGKGAETYQEIMGIKYDYNDKDIIARCIGKLS